MSAPDDLVSTELADDFVYVLNHTGGSISIIDVATLTVLPMTIAVDAQPISITFAPSVNRAFVASDVTDSMTVIDLTTNTVVTEWGGNDPKHMIMLPDEEILWVLEASISRVSGIDIAAGTLAHQFIACVGPAAMAITPDGSTGFVTSDRGC
jgi:YVTN family beta-propeller protein